MPSVEFVSVIEHALALMDKVALFYAKYHMLPVEERWALQHELKQRHHEWGRCSALEQQHVDFVRVLMRELNTFSFEKAGHSGVLKLHFAV